MVIANGSDKAEIHSDYLLDSAPLAELRSTGSSRQLREDEGPTVLQGELIEDEDDNDGQERAAS